MFQVHPCQYDGQPALKLSGELTIYAVSEARRELQPSGKADLVLDLAGIQEIDSAGVQLLAWLKRECERTSRRLLLVNHSPEVVEVFDLLRVAGEFGDPILLSPTGK